ncbi:hypothetical protein [Marinomonas sp. THO17]|uniref:hypothetical protein n=1 Tax=Marinomonas sp. THO17 TaxID=3149048 RepID=UPI00336BDCCD
MSTDKIGSGPACDGTKLFIEVTGVDHDPSYSIQFHDAEENSRDTELEDKKVCQSLGDTSVYSWEWDKKSTSVNASLAIASDTGEILLPLYENVKPKPRVDGEQDYLLHAVVPLTLLPTYNEKLTEKDRYAPSRNGYFYVFYNHKAWREIEMRTPEGGPIVYRDVDLAAYRTGENGIFASEQRDTTGSPLTEIWLPVKDNNKSTVVHLAYSDMPWSGERLNYLEANVSELIERAQSLHKLNGIENAPKNRKSESHVLLASELPEMRAREPALEWLVAAPLQFNKDLSGGWLKETYQEIKDGLKQARETDNTGFEALGKRSAYQFEYGMKQTALIALLQQDDDLDQDWQASDSVDYLEDAKARQLRTLVINDPLFDLKHSAFVTLSAVSYMQQVYADMGQQEYYQTAELTQQIIMTEKFGKKDNPLHQFKDDVSRDLKGRFHRTLRTQERLIANRDIKQLQYYVKKAIHNPRTAEVLKDVSSLNGLNSAGAHAIAGHALSALAIDIDKIDRFSQYQYLSDYLPQDKPMNKRQHLSASDCKYTLTKLLSSNGNELCKVLFPPQDSIPLDADYAPPEPFNDGSGYATPESLAQWSQEDFVLEEDDLLVVDLAMITKANVAASQNDKEKYVFTQVKRVSNIIDSILKGYYEALMSIKDLASEAKVIQFHQAYASLLALTKATNPSYLGKLQFTSVQGAETKGYVVGVHGQGLSFGLSADDREHIKNKRRKGLQGQIREENGRLVVASNKKPFANGDKASLGERGNLKVVVLPEDSAVAQAYNQAQTQRALKNMDNTNLNSSNAYERLRIPYWIVAIETVNLVLNFKHVENFANRKDRIYSGANVISLVLDLGVALTHAATLQGKIATGFVRVANKEAFKIGGKVVTFVNSISGKATLVSSISYLKFAGLIAGLLTAGLAAWDAIRLFGKNDDDAAMAMTMVALGLGLNTLATGLFTTSAPILFGMGPVAWLGIAIAVGGALLYMLFLDTPIEEWLKNGPFGDDPGEQYAHLQDNQVAFERLINCLFSVEVKAYQLGLQTGFSDEVHNAMQSDGVTHAIRVSSNLATLMGLGHAQIEFYVRAAAQEKIETRSRTGIDYEDAVIPLGQKPLPIIASSEGSDSTVYFVKHDAKLPKNYHDTPWLGGKARLHTYAPAFMARVRLHIGDKVFPMPKLDQASFEGELFDPPRFTENETSWINKAVTLTYK